MDWTIDLDTLLSVGYYDANITEMMKSRHRSKNRINGRTGQMGDSDGSPPPRKGSTPAKNEKSQKDNNKKPVKKPPPKEEKVEKLPKRRAYDLRLPGFLTAGLLKSNNVPLDLKDVQLKILVRSKE
jgi:hypothetical protein